MKHLLKFNESDSDSYYIEQRFGYDHDSSTIYTNDNGNIKYYKSILFTESEKEEIDKLMFVRLRSDKDTGGDFRYNTGGGKISLLLYKSERVGSNKVSRYTYRISKTEDEWYFMSIHDSGAANDPITFYKCDQWEGLVKLLNDLFYTDGMLTKYD